MLFIFFKNTFQNQEFFTALQCLIQDPATSLMAVFYEFQGNTILVILLIYISTWFLGRLKILNSNLQNKNRSVSPASTSPNPEDPWIIKIIKKIYAGFCKHQDALKEHLALKKKVEETRKTLLQMDRLKQKRLELARLEKVKRSTWFFFVWTYFLFLFSLAIYCMYDFFWIRVFLFFVMVVVLFFIKKWFL